MQAVAAARVIAEDNARAGPIFLSGFATIAPAANAAAAAAAAVPDVPVNGLFDPSKERGKDGRVIYVKRSDGSMIIEHRAGSWHMKPPDFKGLEACLAFVPGGRSLEMCLPHAWHVHDGKLWVEQASVRMVKGAEAERWVSASCRYRMHLLLFFWI